MMRTSNLFSSCEKIQQTKARSRVQSTTNGGKLLTGLFFFSVVGTQEEKRKSVMSQFFLSCTHKKIERGVCFKL